MLRPPNDELAPLQVRSGIQGVFNEEMPRKSCTKLCVMKNELKKSIRFVRVFVKVKICQSLSYNNNSHLLYK